MTYLYYDQVIEEFESHLDGCNDPIDLLGEDIPFSEALEELRPDIYNVNLTFFVEEYFRTVVLGDEVVYVWVKS